MDWQPIKTAPKDGTWVLLYFPRATRAIEVNVRVGFWGVGDDWFDSECAGTSLTAFGDHPTHWMPLPPPPASA